MKNLHYLINAKMFSIIIIISIAINLGSIDLLNLVTQLCTNACNREESSLHRQLAHTLNVCLGRQMGSAYIQVVSIKIRTDLVLKLL